MILHVGFDNCKYRFCQSKPLQSEKQSCIFHKQKIFISPVGGIVTVEETTVSMMYEVEIEVVLKRLDKTDE